jgi:hypothetical protein
MTVNDLLKALDLSTISTYKIDGELESLQTIKTLYAQHTVMLPAIITAENTTMLEKDVAYNLFIDGSDEFNKLVQIEQQLPHGATYINLCLNIKLKDSD